MEVSYSVPVYMLLNYLGVSYSDRIDPILSHSGSVLFGS